MPSDSLLVCLTSRAGNSYAVPIFDGRIIRDAARRINLGGKALTNYLKEVVSYRSMNMMDEFVLMERIKEQLCYVVRSDALFLQNLFYIRDADAWTLAWPSLAWLRR